MNSRKFGKYVLDRELSHSAVSRTFQATLVGTHGIERRVVIETVHDRAHAKRMEDNARALVGLRHPCIAPIYEVGIARGVRFAALEPVDGASVGEIAHAARLSPDEGAYVGVEVWRALEYARREKSVALDEVNVESVVVDEEGRVHLVGITLESPSHADDARALATTLLQAWGGSEATRPSSIDIRLFPLDEVLARVMRSASGARDADDLGEALRKYLAGIDAPDVARALGEKARAAKERRVSERPPPNATFAMPGAEDGGTRTLAARSELKGWMAQDEKARTPPSLGSIKTVGSVPPPPLLPESIHAPRRAGLTPRPSVIRRANGVAILALVAAVLATLAFLVPAIRQATTVATPTPHPVPPPSTSGAADAAPR